MPRLSGCLGWPSRVRGPGAPCSCLVHAVGSEPDRAEETRILVSALRRTLHGLGAEGVVDKALLGDVAGEGKGDNDCRGGDALPGAGGRCD